MCYAAKASSRNNTSEETDNIMRTDVMSSSVSVVSDDHYQCTCESCGSASPPLSSNSRVVSLGDIVTIDLSMTPENFVPESLFDRNGTISFVVGWGNYLPALHELVQGKAVGEQVSNVSIDAGWGDRNPDLVMELPMAKLKRFYQKDGSFPDVGSALPLQGGIQLSVVQVNEEEETVIVDANPPLAGASYSCSFTILNINDLPAEAAQLPSASNSNPDNHQSTSSRYKVSTWALGCFWGGELAFMRVPGVVGTRAGYTQGNVSNPTYEAVCTGKTHHREAIIVVYDPEVVSFETLIGVAISRLAATNEPNKLATTSSMFGDMFAEDEDEKDSKQYRHGFYYHSEDQRKIVERELASSNPYDIEMKQAAMFYDAEDYHQQYLLKGGQSARKGAKETIRCYG